MFDFLLRWLNWGRRPSDPAERAAARRASEFVESSTPATVVNVRVQADEPRRYVFAIFYRGEPGGRPNPYRLIAVDKTTGLATEIADEEAGRYRLRNYK